MAKSIEWPCNDRPEDLQDAVVARYASVASAFEARQWDRGLELLREQLDDDWWMAMAEVISNMHRLGDPAWKAPLHIAAEQGAPAGIVRRLIARGAWRTLRNAAGERPLDVARRCGASHLFRALEPVYRRAVAEEQVALMQASLHELIRYRAQQLVRRARLPQLDPLLEFRVKARMWYPITGFYGGYSLWFERDGPDPVLLAESWSRICSGSGERHEITPRGARLVEEGFV